MGIKLSEIVAGSRTIPVVFGTATINVTYRLKNRTLEHEVSDAAEGESEYFLVRQLTRLVESWDIEADDGTVLPIDADVIEKELPIPLVRKILHTVWGDDGVGEAEGNSSAG